MGKKYIIEIEDGKEGIILCQKGIVTVGLRLENESELKPLGIQSAIPYTEPDLEQVRKEAYQKGYETGYEDGYNEPGKNQEEVYQRGLSDAKGGYENGFENGMIVAWDAAKKIALMDTETSENVTGYFGLFRIMENLTPMQAIEKIRQYEQDKEEIKVGDEVENTQTGVKFIVTHLWKNNLGEQGVSGFNQECSAFSTTLDLVVKTGHAFPEIAVIFEKMRNEPNAQIDT